MNELINYYDKIDLPILSNGQKQIFDTIIAEKDIYDALSQWKMTKYPVMMDFQKSFMKYFEMI